MDKNLAIELIINNRKNNSSYPDDICIMFFGLNECTLWLSAEDIVTSYGGSLRQYLEEVVGISEASEVLNRDYVIIDVDVDQLTQSFCNGQSFDWDGYAVALEELNHCYLDLDAFKAGLSLGISPFDISESYFGKYKTLELFGEDYYNNCNAGVIPEQYLHYIDFESYGRDICINCFTECDGYYFYNN